MKRVGCRMLISQARRNAVFGQTVGHHNAVFDYLETGEMPASSTYCGQMLATGGGEDEECTVKDAVPAAEAAWTPP